MSRISSLPVEEWDPELQAFAPNSGTSPIERKARSIMAHAPNIMLGNAAFMMTAQKGRQLPGRLLELMRLRIAFHNQCRTCMAMRFKAGVDDGVTEDLVCSLEKPMEAPNLTDREKAALEFADLFATNHFAIDDGTFAKLREQFSDGEIVELGFFAAYYLGFGRFMACLDMAEELPESYQDKSHPIAPWQTPESLAIYGNYD